MGIFVGLIIGFLSGFVFRYSPLLAIVTGGLIGYLFERTIKLNKKLETLRYHLDCTIEEVKGLISKKESTTSSPQAESTSNANAETNVEAITDTNEQALSAISVEIKKDQQQIARGNDQNITPNNTDTIEQSYTKVLTQNLTPQKPNIIFQKLTKFFTGDNAVLRIGTVILFLGIAFLLKYAADHSKFPIWLRLVSVSATAIVILWLGWKLKSKRAIYALGLQGTGIGILYLTVFGALKLTTYLPPSLAFALLIMICIFSAILAIIQDSKTLATMGVIGGFIAPILASTGSGRYDLLFSYYLLLNSGILAIAWYKSWRSLNLVGFFFTFSIGLIWGVRDYQPDMFWTIEIFLLLFFIQFLAISFLFALRQNDNNKGYVDGSLVFGIPMLTFAIQTYLLTTLPQAHEFSLAFSAMALAIIYLYISLLFAKKKSGHYKLFAEASMVIGVLFLSLTIPLALNDGLWTSATWALEGSALLWIGIRQNRITARIFGMSLQLLAGAAFLIKAYKIKLGFLAVFVIETPSHVIAEQGYLMPIFNGFYMGCLTIFIAGMFASYLLYKNENKLHPGEYFCHPTLLMWSLLWWFVSSIIEIQRHVDNVFVSNYTLVMIASSCLAFYLLAKKLNWKNLQGITNHLTPIALIVIFTLNLVNSFITGSLPPFAFHGAYTWPLAFALFYLLYFFIEKDEPQTNTRAYHTLVYLILLTVLTWEIYWQTANWLRYTANWHGETWLVTLLGLLLAIAMTFTRKLCNSRLWPFKHQQKAYLLHAMSYIAGIAAIWFVLSTLSINADPTPIKYIPFLNPLELSQALIFMSLMSWLLTLKNKGLYSLSLPVRRNLPRLISVVLFVWFNSLLVRTLGHWGNVPFKFDAMLRSPLAQSTFSICWTLLALCSMFYATRKSYRGIWYGGAILLILVIAKLLLLDLSNINTLGRITSFIGVGVMLLIIGYFSPLPPKPKSESQSKSENKTQNQSNN